MDEITLFRSSKMFKKSWTPKEDAKLLRLVEIHGALNWSIICDSMGGNRTGKQCRERYHNHLQPDIKKGEWSEEEDRMIADMYSKLGSAWSKMTKTLPGRTDNAIKNRWHTAHRHQIRIQSAMPPTIQSELTSLPSKTAGSKMLIPRLTLPSRDEPVEKSASNTEENQDFPYDHSLHGHELTLSSRSDISLPEASSSNKCVDLLTETAVSLTKSSPRLDIISSSRIVQEQSIKLVGGSSKPAVESVAVELGRGSYSGIQPSLSCMYLPELDTLSAQDHFAGEESKQSLLELNLDFLYTSSPSSCFDEEDDDDLSASESPDSPLIPFANSGLLEDADECFSAMYSMAISPRSTPRSPLRHSFHKKQRM